MTTKKKLAAVLQLSECKLRQLSRQSDDFYSEWDDIKACGKRRRIENPKKPLKIVQSRIARLLSRIEPPDFLFCPVKGRSYVSNAQRHAGNRVIRCLDIRKYFPSTSARRVYWFFHTRMGCVPDVAALLTSLCTYKEHLPTGSPVSPILSFFAHVDMWEEIATRVSASGCTLSVVYIDDVTVSGSHVRAGLLWEVKRAIHRVGLRYHKTKSYFEGTAEVTGVAIRGDAIALPNRQHRKLFELRKAVRTAPEGAVRDKLRQQLKGREAQARQVFSANMQA